MRLLVLNSNTSPFVTETIASAARKMAAPGTQIVMATGAFGARVIETRTELAIAQHATVDAIARHAENCDGILVSASYDVATRAARELTGKPVLGITEAPLMAAMATVTRIGVISFGHRVATLYRELIDSYGWTSRIAALTPIESADPYAPVDQTAVERQIIATARRQIAEADAEVIVLLGAVMAGRSLRFQEELEVPVLDGIRCGVPMLEAMVRIAPKRASRGSYAPPTGRPTVALAEDLAARLK
jgi:allantoin racemase